MSPFEWRSVGDHDPKRLAEARNQLLSATQWLARIERSYAAPHDPEVSLRWLDDRNVISTHDLGSELSLVLNVDDLRMQFNEAGNPSDHEIDVEERSPAHIEAWLLIELLHRGVDRERFSKDLPYDSVGLLNGDGVEFSPGEYEPELRALDAWMRNAAQAIKAAAAAPGGQDDVLRVSPRDLRVQAAAGGRVLGFSPGDEMIPEPFFFVAEAGGADGAAEPIAVLRASEIRDSDAPERVVAFLRAGGQPTTH